MQNFVLQRKFSFFNFANINKLGELTYKKSTERMNSIWDIKTQIMQLQGKYLRISSLI